MSKIQFNEFSTQFYVPSLFLLIRNMKIAMNTKTIIRITKIDDDGNVENEAVFPPEISINNNLFSIVEVEDGTYVVSGTKNAESKVGNVWIAKIGKSEVPEFSLWTILSLFLIATMSMIVIRNKLITKT
jgi:hypothetical protein